MKLWLLRPIEENKKAWEPWYNKNFGSVVRAETEVEARAIGSIDAHGNEGPNVWLDSMQTSCIELLPEGKAEMVTLDFRAS